MAETDKRGPGEFCWVELMTSDIAAAKEFYAAIMGWEYTDDPIPDGGAYTMARAGGKNAAGLFAIDEQMKAQGVPPSWSSYVAVESADEAVSKAEELGGKVIRPAFDVMDVGRMAVLSDPGGAVFCVWEAKKHEGMELSSGATGGLCWNELMTANVDRAGKFYADLFGWSPQTQDMGGFQYTVFMQGEKGVGGMLAMEGEAFAGIPPHWGVYFLVDSCDGTVEKVKELGGGVMGPPEEVPQVGRFATCRDPQGAVFSVLQPAPQE